MNRISPEKVVSLGINQIFVFGSNESGFNGAGAAFLAQEKFHAKFGVGFGPSGMCFAIPTKNWYLKESLPLDVIQFYINRFVAYARVTQDKEFVVTQIGCGLA